MSVRHDSFFWQSHLSLFKQMLIICCFCEDMRVTVCSRDVGISEDNAVDYYDNLRGCYADALEADPIHFTSLGPYEIDEFLIKHVDDGHGGRLNLLVMDILERNSGLYWAEVVSNRSAEVMISIITRMIPLGSLIFTDDWGAYQPLRRSGFQHHSVNHSAGEYSRSVTIQRKDVEVSINSLEGLHRSLRQRVMNKSRRNVDRIDLILREVIYRRSGRSLWQPFKLVENQ